MEISAWRATPASLDASTTTAILRLPAKRVVLGHLQQLGRPSVQPALPVGQTTTQIQRRSAPRARRGRTVRPPTPLGRAPTALLEAMHLHTARIHAKHVGLANMHQQHLRHAMRASRVKQMLIPMHRRHALRARTAHMQAAARLRAPDANRALPTRTAIKRLRAPDVSQGRCGSTAPT